VDEAKKRAIEFGRRLREVREKNGDSLREIERRSGLNNGYLSQLENGKIVHPSPSVLQKVALGYGLRFEDVLRWTGYVVDPNDEVTPNQAVVLSTVSALGDPSDEEVHALKAIVELLQRSRAATFAAPSDLPLEDEATREIRRSVIALLREAEALGRRPTPLDDIHDAARLVMAGELSLNPRDRARLIERFGKWVGIAWKRLQGTFDFRTSEIWVKPDLHPMKRRFVLSHEIGHAILPAHKDTFAYIDDFTRLPPFARDLFEREANQAAAEILFQGGELTDEFDSSSPSLREICDLSTSFGASVVSTARYAAETSRRPVAVAVAHRNERGLGPTHIYASRRFDAAFGWRDGAGAPWSEIRTALRTAQTEASETWVVNDRRGEPHVVHTQKMDTGFAAIVLAAPESRKRGLVRRLVPVASGAVRLRE
jgi:transcriptional regulator with XRE-family HTH domain